MLISGRAHKFIPLIIAVLIAAFVLLQFDLIRLDDHAIPTFGFNPSSPDPQPSVSTVPSLPVLPKLDQYPTPIADAAPRPNLDSDPEPSQESRPADVQDNEEQDAATPGLVNSQGTPKKFDYRVVHSQSKPDGKYWPIAYASDSTEGYNANVIPHPTKTDHWVVVAQRAPTKDKPLFPAVELTCAAQFTLDGTLKCTQDATELAVSPSIVGKCEGKLAVLNMGGGPRDGRVFYGRDAAYIFYGSQASYTCMGVWLHDLSTISTEFHGNESEVGSWFLDSVEIRRPPPWRAMEKNYFLFWDNAGTLYAQYDFWPERSFAQIGADGSAGPNLAEASREHDRVCMANYLSALPTTEYEAIHQATNSLQITLCQRSDPKCIPNDDNTFVMHIYHLQSYYDFHGVYEPYVYLFKRSSPFALYAISQKPFWISGRGPLTVASDAEKFRKMPEAIPPDHTEMFYITSWNWKNPGQYDHGYIDDVVNIAFGIEDSRSGVLDVKAGDLLQDLSFCDMD